MSATPRGDSGQGAARKSAFVAAFVLFLAAFGLRVAAIALLDTTRAAQGDTWEWGAESACLARSMLEQHVYGDPWCHGTGPSSWLTPPYPALVALAMALGGGVTHAAAWLLLTVQSGLSAWTALLLCALGARLGAPRAGRWAGWLWALYPLAIWNAAKTVWDTTAVAFAVVAFLVVFVGPRDGPRSLAHALRAGLAYGALLFLNPAPLAFFPGLAWWMAREGRGRARRMAVFAAAALCVCLPWMLRNRSVLGTWALRPNLGVELRIGNHDEANGRPVPFKYHPSGVQAERDLYVRLGEVAYGEENLERAKAWIRAHPAAFARLCATRARFFWVGESPLADVRREGAIEPSGDWNSWLKYAAFLGAFAFGALGLARLRARPGTRPFLAMLLVSFGGPYYVTHVSERYRFPIDPLLVLGAGALAAEWIGRSSASAQPNEQGLA